MNGMLWTEEVIENNTLIFLNMTRSFSLYLIMKYEIYQVYQRGNCIKRDIWSDMILLSSITLFLIKNTIPKS